jgi:hypothetical protein
MRSAPATVAGAQYNINISARCRKETTRFHPQQGAKNAQQIGPTVQKTKGRVKI